MTLSETDAELLELAALTVPWHLVCGEFHQRYGSPRALAERLFELERTGLLTISRQSPEEPAPTPEVLEADALSNECYDGFDPAWEPRWNILVTETGFTRIRGRLEEQ